MQLLSDLPQAKNGECVVLVDGSYYLYRAFYGAPHLATSTGIPTGAVLGVQKALTRIIKRYNPSFMAVAFDTKSPTFRHKLSATYKAHRPPTPAELVPQFDYAYNLVDSLGICRLVHEDFEADDILGTLARIFANKGYHVIISSGDKDLMQLVDDYIILENSFDNKQYDHAGVVAKFGVSPAQMIDYLTLVGDASDGISGVAGIGAKGAAALLQEYGTLDNLLANAHTIKGKKGETLCNSSQSIALDRQLATINTQVKLDLCAQDLRLQPQNISALQALYTQLEFFSQLDKLPAQSTEHKSDDKLMDNNTINSNVSADFDDSTNQPHATKSNIAQNFHTQLQKPLIIIERTDDLFMLAPILATNKRAWWVCGDTSAYILALATEQACALLCLSEDFTIDAVRAHLGDKLGGIYHDYKSALHLLNADTLPSCALDIMLASYVKDASQKHTLQALAQKHGIILSSLDDIIGSGKKRLSFDEIALDAQTHADLHTLCHQYVAAIWCISEHFILDNLLSLEIEVAKVLYQMERAGILIDSKFFENLSQEFSKKIIDLETLAHKLAGEPFNVASPKQLGEILFDKLALQGAKTTKSGQYATGEEVLNNLDHPLADTVLAHRELAKLKSTYTDALVNVADQNRRVHTHYHQALTSTGRLSSKEPNLQNIPIRTPTGRQIRKGFIAPKDKVLVAADYSQIELRLMAHFSGDPTLTHAFAHGIDIHTQTAADVLGKSIDKITIDERRAAKAVNFGLLYGMSGFGLAKQLGVSPAIAKAYIERYFARYPAIKTYMDNTRTHASEHGFVHTILGRKIYFPTYLKGAQKAAALRAAINAPLQGSAADIIKLAMCAVADLTDSEHLLLLQVHDELVFEAPKDSAHAFANTIKHAMQSVLSTDDFAIPLMVQIGIGENWEEAH